MQKNELEALIQLLDDPDDKIFVQVRTKIEEIGLPIIDDLELAWVNTADPFLQHRIEDLISSIQKDHLKNKLRIWLRKKPDDLIHGAILAAKFQYPDLDSGEVRKYVENIQQAIWLELQENLTPLEKVNIFNQVFYSTFGFGGNLKNVFNPQNNFIHICVERKKGSPIMLGLIYVAIAQNLGFPIFGVDLPYHFALAYCNTRGGEKFSPNPKKVLFYINPIAKGIIFSNSEIKDYLTRMEIDEQMTYFEPIDNKSIVQSLFQHLKICYINNSDQEKAEGIQEFIDIFLEELPE